MGHSSVEAEETKEMDIRSFSSSRHNQTPYIHKVGVPPKQDIFKELKTTVKETFFADDPLRCFKDQPRSRKFVLGLQAIFPILEWGRSYNFAKFRGDLIAGLTIASLCIPQVKRMCYCANEIKIVRIFTNLLSKTFNCNDRTLAIPSLQI